MSLTNIVREPRRELTETAVGIAIFSVVLLADYPIAVWLCELDGTMPLVAGFIIGLPCLLILFVLLVGVHTAGEFTCNRMEARGIRLRPAQRWR